MRIARGLFVLMVIAMIAALPSGIDAGWAINGAPVVTVGGIQDEARICRDDLNGAIIAWRDRRSTADIYAQLLDNMGRRQWLETGVLICGAGNVQEHPRIVADGSGGAIIVWEDFRDGVSKDIYAQRINAAGTILWTADGVAVCLAAGSQTNLKICPDGAGGFIVAWVDLRTAVDFDIYAQRLDIDGNMLWTADGVEICGAAGNQHEVDLVSDGNGGAFLVWNDGRSTMEIYAQHVNSAGVVQWTADGISIRSDSNEQYYPRIVTDGAGGFYVSLYNSMHRGYIQRVSSDGTLLFSAAGLILGENNPDYTAPEMIADGIGGAIIVWQDWNDGDHYDAYAQRVDRSGALLWSTACVPVCTFGGSVYSLGIISDGERGAIISWRDTRSIGTTHNNIFAQRLDSLGVAQWTTDGDSLCTAEGSQADPVITTDGAGGAIVAWKDNRTDNDIYAMRILASGDFTSTALSSFQAGPGSDGVMIEWVMSSVDDGISFRVLRAECEEEFAGDAGDRFEELVVIASDGTDLEFSYLDTSAKPGKKYIYRVVMVEDGVVPGGDIGILFETKPAGLPNAALMLNQNIPNPFNPATTIFYSLPVRAEVRLDVFDLSGRHIAGLVEGVHGPGECRAVWNGMNDDGEPVSSGLYFYRLLTGKERLTRKMILLR
jgi:hypothetical protein